MLKHFATAALATLVSLSAIPCGAETSINAAGSTALLPLVKEAATQYQRLHPDVKINVSGGGSRVGITQAASRSVEIGDSDIIAPGGSGLVDHRVAVVGFAIIAHPAVGTDHLNAKQIRDIFAGRVSNWKQVGGADQNIVVINRPRSSGTRAVFTQTIMGASKINEAGLTEDSSGTVLTTVKGTPGAISYVAFSYVRGIDVMQIRVNRVAPTDENVRSGKYPIWSYEHMYTNGRANREVESFIAFVAGNRRLVSQLGYVPMSDMRVTENNR
ncbi:MAG: phosphate ABC transporter substrate-binding protein PstS family protein [Candidatus Eremiobacteraeota bacterium]|nr:phosphate ABC transporter substrate-binding protein PstS family protein [Candidatus Eremiobacteraeota bacterium]